MRHAIAQKHKHARTAKYLVTHISCDSQQRHNSLCRDCVTISECVTKNESALDTLTSKSLAMLNAAHLRKCMRVYRNCDQALFYHSILLFDFPLLMKQSGEKKCGTIGFSWCIWVRIKQFIYTYNQSRRWAHFLSYLGCLFLNEFWTDAAAGGFGRGGVAFIIRKMGMCAFVHVEFAISFITRLKIHWLVGWF